jgi:O-antigen/teichoic acid export membrane protein
LTILSKNVFSNIIGQLLLALLGFVAVKFIYKSLGDEALGIIYFSFLVNAILIGILDKGIYSTTVREVSMNFNSNKKYINKFVQTFSFITWGAVLSFSLILYLMVPYLVSGWINISSISINETIIIVQILTLSSLMVFPTSLYASLLRGIQRMEYVNIIDVSLMAVQQIGIIFLIQFSGEFVHVVYWIGLSYVLKLMVYFLVCIKFFNVYNFLPIFSYIVFKRNTKFTLDMIYMSALAMIYKQADKVAISKIQSISTLGFYGFAYNAISKATILTSSISSAAYPSLCELNENTNKKKLLFRYRLLQEMLLFANVPIFAFVIFASLPLFTFIFDENISKELLLPSVILSFGFYLNGSLSLPYRILLVKGRTEIAVKQDFFALMFVLPFVILAVYFLGLVGASLGLLLYVIFSCFYMVPKVYRLCLNINEWEFFRLLFKVIFLGTLTFGTIYIALIYTENIDIKNLFFAYLIAGILFFLLSYNFVSSKLKKQLITFFLVEKVSTR